MTNQIMQHSSERLGTSRTIQRKQYTAPRAVKGLCELLDNQRYATKAAEIARLIQAENGVCVACDATLAAALTFFYHRATEGIEEW